MSLSPTLLLSAVIAALGGLLFGFDTAVISGAEQRLEDLFSQGDATAHGFLVASALVGTILGALFVGRPADSLGRRAVMFGLAVLYFISALGSALAWDWWSFVAFRLIGGLGVGGASVVSPMYIAEISPARVRGRLVALAQFNIVLGILLAFLSNYLVQSFGLGAAGGTQWRWMLGVEAAPALAYFCLLFFCPRSPRWLVAQGRYEEARRVLQRVGVDAQAGSVDAELSAIQESIDAARDDANEGLFQRKYAQPILLAFAIAAFNQLSGINAILYYSTRIFQSAGFGENASLLGSVGLGAMNLVFTIAALLVIDRFGRRTLMLAGSVGYIASLAVTAWAFYVYGGEFNDVGRAYDVYHELQASGAGPDELAVAREQLEETVAAGSRGGMVVMGSLLVFIASHAFGQGAVIWVFISEIFPNRVRARGQAFGSFTHWVFAAVISQTFPLIAEASGWHAFAFYTACMIGQLLWVLRVMPETKGVPLEEIQRRLNIA